MYSDEVLVFFTCCFRRLVVISGIFQQNWNRFVKVSQNRFSEQRLILRHRYYGLLMSTVASFVRENVELIR